MHTEPGAMLNTAQPVAEPLWPDRSPVCAGCRAVVEVALSASA